MATFYDTCTEIWGGCLATTSMEHGVDTTDFKGIDITEGIPYATPRSVSSPIVAYDLNASVRKESSEVGLSLKMEMVSEMKQMDKEYQQTMARFSSAMENLSDSVSSAFLDQVTGNHKCHSIWLNSSPSKETGHCQAGAMICIMLKKMITNMHPCN